jgi:hypothetical protein
LEGTAFNETDFFRAIAGSNARALLIGRRALIVLGLPVLTADYDFWVHPEDVVLLNDAVRPLALYPNHTPDEVRKRGRYVLQNDETVDVHAARRVSTIDGHEAVLDEVWSRRQAIEVAAGVQVALPSIDDLILTKRFAPRPRDAEDIRLLEALKRRREESR